MWNKWMTGYSHSADNIEGGCEPEDILKMAEGRVIASVTGETGDETAEIVFEDGSSLLLWHEQDCCEHVVLDEIQGSVATAVGERVLDAVVHRSIDEDEDALSMDLYDDSFTWTYYTIRTRNATLVFRWYGASNGYYSEEVDLTFSKRSDEEREG